jgi:hypothetical protein
MIDFRTQKSCMRCQWHRMHENFLLRSPFKFIYFFSGGVGQFRNVYVLLDIPFKDFQSRSNRSSIVHISSYFAWGANDTACIVHAVSLTPYACLIFFCIPSLFCIWLSLFEVVRKMTCGVINTACTVHAVSLTPHAPCMHVNYTACTVHAVSMTPHAPCMRYQWHRMHCALKIRISSRIRIYIRKGFSPLTEGRKSCDTVPLTMPAY